MLNVWSLVVGTVSSESKQLWIPSYSQLEAEVPGPEVVLRLRCLQRAPESVVLKTFLPSLNPTQLHFLLPRLPLSPLLFSAKDG